MDLQTRSDLHLKRKFFHAFGVLLMFGVFQFLNDFNSWAVLLFFMGVTIATDIYRLRNPWFNEKAIRILKPIIRESEKNNFSAMAYLLFGTGICFLIFDKTIVSLCLLFLAFGDPFASGFGIKFGKTKWMGQKSIEGTFAAFVVCAVAAYAYYRYFGLFPASIVMVSSISGVIGAISEAIPLGTMDDNFSQPILSGTLLTLLFYLISTL